MMSRLYLSRAAAVVVTTLTATFAQADMASSEERAMTGKELQALYEDKTWMWGNGGGYFGKGQAFRARTGDRKTRSWVYGQWSASDDGVMCFRGKWRAQDSKKGKYAKTCFEHRAQGLKIYQRRLPKGEWYVFRDDPRQPSDQDLQAGNRTGLR